MEHHGRTRVKLCGLTRPQDLAQATRLGVDAVGFVLVPGSPRSLELRQAAELSRMVPAWCSRVGVVAAEQRHQAPSFAEACRFDTLQLMGPPDPAYCAYYRGRFAMVPVLGVPSGPGAAPDYNALQTALDEVAPHVDAVLLDASVAGKAGGTGVSFDWAALRELHAACPVLVAGGLKPSNVGELVRTFRPAGVDVSSGVESAPGQKDPLAIAAFLAAVAAADRQA